MAFKSRGSGKVQRFDELGQCGYPYTLVFNTNFFYSLIMVLVALDFGLGILAAAVHGAHAAVGHHFHRAGGGFVQYGHALYPAHAQVLVYGEAK